jgi:predicted adenine nucleotide alpha hydrolase (AANH) superfamily ATPase
MRLDRAARRASELGAECFTSTLLVSHHQDREALVEAGELAARAHGVRFDSPDLRNLHGTDGARPRDLKLCRQGYCGCVFSEEERYGEAARDEGREPVPSGRREEP